MYFPGWRTFWWRYIAGPGAIVVFAALIALLIPALSAHEGNGRQGRWTATNILCGHNGCNEIGTFLSADGGDRRTGISMFGGPDLAIGQAAPAVDTGGDEVYPPGGGDAWWHDLIGVSAAGLAVAAWLWAFPIRVLRRRRLRQQHSDPAVA
ncbi:hypothetical protein AB0L42_34515 [Streptomyces sp. NPDC052287]|uniref:hypothetical protein n=1 Tax=Streptomyces sp. NPDC052287 TaxID=3154950 RepID=UPI0034227E6E